MTTTTRDTWDPAQYRRFGAERQQPFFDLLALVRPQAEMHVVDLGCGDGELTKHMHRALRAAHTLGVDTSAAMLERARAYAEPTLTFELRDLGGVPASDDERYDLVFTNAAVQWLPDHEALLPRLASAVAPGGQLAVQMPANHDHPSHVVADEVAAELGLPRRSSPVLPVERYAELLDGAGLIDVHARVQVYLHHLQGPADVIEWVRGTLLTWLQARVDEATFQVFLDRYRTRLLAALPDRHPYPFAFKRILLWARKPL